MLFPSLVPRLVSSRMEQRSPHARGPQVARLRGSKRDLDKVHVGSHSLWVALLIAQRPYRTLSADSVVAVLLEDRLELRISATAFTMTVHYTDIVRLTYCPVRHALFMHAEVCASALTTSSWAAAERCLSTLAGSGPIPSPRGHTGEACADAAHRVYVLELVRHDPQFCIALFKTLLARIPAAARRESGEDECSLDSLLVALDSRAASPSLITDPVLRETAGLQEMTPHLAQNWLQRWATQAVPAPAPSATTTAVPPEARTDSAGHMTPHRTPVPASFLVAAATHSEKMFLPRTAAQLPATMPIAIPAGPRGPHDLFRIYHAPCPQSWWPQRARLTHTSTTPMWPVLQGGEEVHVPVDWPTTALTLTSSPSAPVAQPSDTRHVIGPRLVPPAPVVVSTDYRATLLDVEYGTVVKL